MTIDHLTLTVPLSKLDDTVAFLTASLQHLGFKEMMRPAPGVVGLGEVLPYFWINTVDEEATPGSVFEKILKSQHLAFVAENKEQVDAFHAAALKAGGTCNGPPGPRAHYHPRYYGAYVLDPAVGVNFEVVCHTA